jgi:hypothetical protein
MKIDPHGGQNLFLFTTGETIGYLPSSAGERSGEFETEH